MAGIHHVTAISGKAAHNLEFYKHVIGLRFVKKTVNFDDPGTYHLYYGDRVGHPGTILTFFPWEHAAPGRAGVGLTQQTAFRIPVGSIGYWTHRLVEKGVAHQQPERRFGEQVLSFGDPDGMSLALVGVTGAEAEPAWDGEGVPAEHAIRGFHGVTLMIEDGARTAAILRDVLGFKKAGQDGTLARFTADATVGGIVDIREAKGFLRGHLGRGSVHHIAFRAADDATQAAMARKLETEHGLHPTPQLDRQYFRSVYFREPGGILFEIATDAPGFAVDEPVESLGEHLKLPPFLEARRKEIEAVLPALDAAEQPA
jgi:glyoxalase family protein